jgi:hypothetical protein
LQTAPTDPRTRRITRVSSLALLAFGTTCLVMLAWRHPDELIGRATCPWFLLTGTRCAGCGMTRALHLLLHGQVLEALRHNVMILVIAPFGVATYRYLILALVRGRYPVVRGWPPWLAYPLIAIVIFQFAYRVVIDLRAGLGS